MSQTKFDYNCNSMPHKPTFPPLLGITLGILAVSTASLFIRFAQQDVPSLVIAAYRLSIATLVIAPYALIRQRGELLALGGKQWLLGILSGVFLAIHFATWITSLAFTTVASSVVLVSTTPLWVALLAPIFLKEKLSRGILLGMLLTFIGGVAIGISDACPGGTCPPLAVFINGRAFIGDLLALVGAFAAAGYMLAGRNLRKGMSLPAYTFIVYGAAALLLLIAVPLSGKALFGYPNRAYLWLILLALIPQLLGHSSFNWALRYFSAAFVSITLLGEPIGSTILAYAFLGEVPTLVKSFGAILILVGIVFASLKRKPHAPTRGTGR
ncbi:MAG: DMT family transporter [Anaerolineales bacterium]|nr:DMT family transporter [Anaerolineales bacterium]